VTHKPPEECPPPQPPPEVWAAWVMGEISDEEYEKSAGGES
jgi:hypothetical protein